MSIDNLIEYFKEDNPTKDIESYSTPPEVIKHKEPNSYIDIGGKDLKREIEKYRRLNNKLEKEIDLLRLDRKIIDEYKRNIGREAQLKASILKELKKETTDHRAALKKCIEYIGILSGDKAFKSAAEKNMN